jgi:hypothetical protein
MNRHACQAPSHLGSALQGLPSVYWLQRLSPSSRVASCHALEIEASELQRMFGNPEPTLWPMKSGFRRNGTKISDASPLSAIEVAVDYPRPLP